MTDNSDRQDGDGLLAADELFESSVLAAMHATLSSAVIEAMTAMVRDADAGLSIQRATLPTILFAKEILATCATPPTRNGAEGADAKADVMLATMCAPAFGETASPKPAPDAMREALAKKIENAWRWEHRTSVGHFVESLATDEQASIVAALRSAPVPPADGARITRLEQTIRDSIEALERNSTSAPVVECLKAALSTPPAVAAEPDFETAALALGFRKREQDGKWWHPNQQHFVKHHDTPSEIFDWYFGEGWGAKVASPPVRDREAIARIIAPESFAADYQHYHPDRSTVEQFEAYKKADAILSLPVQPVAPHLPQDTLDRLANADASQEEIKDALAKAYAILRWNAKLEDLPDEMKDDCYGFAGVFVGVQSGAGEREAEWMKICDELGCAYDKDSLLIAIDNLKQRASGCAEDAPRICDCERSVHEDGDMSESHSEYLTAWTRFRNTEWDGCSHLDCLPECRRATGNYHCERFERAFALSRQAPHSSSETE